MATIAMDAPPEKTTTTPRTMTMAMNMTAAAATMCVEMAMMVMEVVAAVVVVIVACPLAAADYPDPVESDYRITDFEFHTGEVLPELNLRYRTLGEPRVGEDGRTSNAVLIMHGTTGSGAGFLSDRFAGELFASGQVLDAQRYFIVLTDAIGHGGSSRPSSRAGRRRRSGCGCSARSWARGCSPGSRRRPAAGCRRPS